MDITEISICLTLKRLRIREKPISDFISALKDYANLKH
ncbi:hypothetical protein JL09_g5761 [Pichia kudriavzevii]|uniref:Uncharacterized protein n=1 Tax=Pichia kudriavzevii TaxID=4909 RepID=A0A099NSR3_PICKU|nr:hypothetical protein JL09_g5761 [Pichia kudriavzevii]